MKKIVLTGGGTAGHVTPNIAMFDTLKEKDYEIYYVGSKDGIEKKLIEEFDVSYFGISSGKLRRYFDLQNFTDPFRVIKGYAQARAYLKKLKPDLVFSKGGFVTVPVILAAKHLKIPCVIHESDLTPGLANKISLPAATKICVNFPETLEYLPPDKAVLTGSPIRQELLKGDKSKALARYNFSLAKPSLLIIGGSTGSAYINGVVRDALPMLLKDYQIVHLCGKGNLDKEYNNSAGYVQLEYAKSELADLFAMTDIVISRAGANAICELLALKKPNLLIPLSARASRGDQILNARSFEQQGYSMVLEEDDLSTLILLENINTLYQNREKYIKALSNSKQMDSIKTITGIFDEIIGLE